MLKYSAAVAKINLKVQLLQRKHEITDEGFLKYLKTSIDEEGELYIHAIEDAFPYLFDFYVESVPVPTEIFEDHADGWNYYIAGVLHIPALLPYVHHPSFIEFTRAIETIESLGYGNLIEFVYLPDSKMLTDHQDESVYQQFASQPATFMIGMQDNGAMNMDTTIKFMLELREINSCIMKLIHGENEGREIAA